MAEMADRACSIEYNNTNALTVGVRFPEKNNNKIRMMISVVDLVKIKLVKTH